MMHRGFEIDYGNLGVLRERIQNRVNSFCLPILERGKRPHPDGHTITAQHAHKFRQVLGLVTIHHHAFAMFQRPARTAWFEHDRIATHFVNPDLH
jgi:hypothetical protein